MKAAPNNTNVNTMKITNLFKSVFAVIGLALFFALRLQAQTNVIYFDPFSGASGSVLNGIAPQDHGGIGADLWIGPDAGIELNGTAIAITAGPRNAYLPFFPEDGYKYRVSADMSTTHTGDDWFAIGFSQNTSLTTAFQTANASGWFLLRGANTGYPVHSFTGYNTDGGAGVGFYSGPHSLAVVLDTTVDNWTFEYFIDGKSVRGPVAFSTTPGNNPLISFVAIGGYNTARGTIDNFKFETIFHVENKPAIQQQPSNATVILGGTAIFSATASGAKPLFYQWLKNGKEVLPDQTGSTLTLNNLALADNGTTYSLIVSNSFGSVASSQATLTVLNVPGPLVHKFNFNDGTANDTMGGVKGALKGTASIKGGQLLLDGSDAGFVALSDYVVPPSGNATVVAWFKASSTVGLRSRVFDFGSGTLNYLYFSPYLGSPGNAQCGIRTSTDPETSVAYTPALNDNTDHMVAVVVNSTPTDTGANGTIFLYIDGILAATNDLNGTAALSALASGPQNFFGKSQWVNTGDAFFKGSIDEVRIYTTVLSQAAIAALSPDANPTIPPAIIDQPKDAYAFIGGAASFTVNILGSSPLSYQWRLNGAGIAGSNTNTYRIDNVQSNHFGNYSVVVTNDYGSITSSVVRLIQTRWSYAAWNDDASSGVDTNYFYTHAYNFGNAQSAEINGLTFSGIAGINPSIPGVFFVNGMGYAYNNDVNNITGGGQMLATDFVYGGAPGSITLYGLSPGKEYLLTLFSVAFDAVGNRRIQFSAAGGQQLLIDQDMYDNNNGIRVNYQYTADASGTVTITNNQTVANTTFHCYGFCNRMLKLLAANSAPEILTPPSSAAVASGAPFSLTVLAGSLSPMQYQWQFHGANISGAASNVLSFDSVQSANFGDYTVVIKNNYGSVTSQVVRLSLLRWSNTNWTDDATSGVDTNYVYTHAYNWGRATNAVINGLTFRGLAGGNPSVSNVFAVTGMGSVYNNDANNITGGCRTLANDFIYGGSPGTLTLYGLTPGKEYLLTLFSAGWEAPGGRLISFSAADNQSTIIDQDTYDNNNGHRISYQYTADASSSVSITNTVTKATFTFHCYGFCNRELQLPAASLLIARGGDGKVTLSWPESVIGFTLHSTTALGAAASWQPVTTTPVLKNGFYEVALPADRTQFFRLQK